MLEIVNLAFDIKDYLDEEHKEVKGVLTRIRCYTENPSTIDGENLRVEQKNERFARKESRRRDARSIDDRNASVQPGCALETELEDATTRHDVAVADDVVDGLWLDLILTLRVRAFV